MGDRRDVKSDSIGWRMPSGTIIAFLAVAGVILLLTWLSLTSLRQIRRNERLVIDAHETAHLLSQVQSLVVDAETSQRGFIITGEERYLEPLQAAERQLPALLEQLVATVPTGSKLGRDVAELKKVATSRFGLLHEGRRLRLEESADAARDFIIAGHGKLEMDHLRELVKTLHDEQNEILRRRSSDSLRSHETATTTILAATCMALVMACIACYFSLREVHARQRAATELERRVEQRTRELADANEALQLSNRELEQFASVASHDLQEPLRKIEAFGDRLNSRCRDSLSQQGIEYLDRVLDSASRMRTLINDLLSYARVASRAQPFVPVDCTRVVNEVVNDLESRIHDMGGLVEVQNLPAIEADPTQLRQLFQNLISNALKFRKPDVAPVVRISADLAGSNGSSQCLFQVSDNGIGFDEIYLDRIFEVFQRLHGRSEYEGTGIGLAICRKIVERHGGTITARSQPGEGSTFLIHLPVKQVSEQ